MKTFLTRCLGALHRMLTAPSSADLMSDTRVARLALAVGLPCVVDAARGAPPMRPDFLIRRPRRSGCRSVCRSGFSPTWFMQTPAVGLKPDLRIDLRIDLRHPLDRAGA